MCRSFHVKPLRFAVQVFESRSRVDQSAAVLILRCASHAIVSDLDEKLIVDTPRKNLNAGFSNHLLLFRVALDTLKHRDVSQVDGVFEWFVRLVAGLAFPGCQSAEVNRMLEVDCLRTCRGPR